MRARIVLFVAIFSYLFCGSAFAQKRVALVIGNSAYKAVPKLINPENDATTIGLLFKKAGFDSVEVRQNLTNGDMRKVVRDFSESTNEADVAVVFFAGHGIEVGGTNYLIPVDSALKRDIDVEDEAISLDRVLLLLEPAKKLRLVILDACRDNPFAATMARTLASRSVGRGLSKVETQSSDTLIAYAAKAGSIALDGQGSNSPFTLALLKHLTTPGLVVRLAFGRVRDEVLATANKKQEPFVYGALGGATVTLAALSPIPNEPTPRPEVDGTVSQDYERTAKVGTREAWQAFLKKHSTGFYADLARAQLAKLAPAENSAAPVPKAGSPPEQSGQSALSRDIECCVRWMRATKLPGFSHHNWSDSQIQSSAPESYRPVIEAGARQCIRTRQYVAKRSVNSFRSFADDAGPVASELCDA